MSLVTQVWLQFSSRLLALVRPTFCISNTILAHDSCRRAVSYGRNLRDKAGKVLHWIRLLDVLRLKQGLTQVPL